MKVKQNMIQIDQTFQIINTEYLLKNALLNLVNNQPDIDKIYLYAKDLYEAKYQYLINRSEKEGVDHFKILKLL